MSDILARVEGYLSKDRTSDCPSIGEFRDEIIRLEKWVADLQSGMYVNCVYCGHRYGPGDTTPVTMSDALKAHIATCPEHPMAALLTACKTALPEIEHEAEQRECSGTGEYSESMKRLAAQIAAAIDKVQP